MALRIDKHAYACQYNDMNKSTKRITANLSKELLVEATKITQKGITDTLIEGLHLIKRTSVYDLAQELKGKLNLDIDIGRSRERNHR